MLDIKVEGLEELSAYFRQLERRLARGFQPFLQSQATSLIRDQIRLTFNTAGYGTWPPRTSGGTHPLLIKSGRYLRDSIQTPIIKVNRNTLRYGVTTPYARFHEYGTVYIPRRSVFALSAERAEDDIVKSARTYLAAIVRNPRLS